MCVYFVAWIATPCLFISGVVFLMQNIKKMVKQAFKFVFFFLFKPSMVDCGLDLVTLDSRWILNGQMIALSNIQSGLKLNPTIGMERRGRIVLLCFWRCVQMYSHLLIANRLVLTIIYKSIESLYGHLNHLKIYMYSKCKSFSLKSFL